jgi:hypothetical protein
MRLKSDGSPILDSFTVWGLVIGSGKILLIVLQGAHVSLGIRSTVAEAIFAIAAACALAYLWCFFKPIWQKGVTDRLMFVFVNLVFVVLFVVSFFIL